MEEQLPLLSPNRYQSLRPRLFLHPPGLEHRAHRHHSSVLCSLFLDSIRTIRSAFHRHRSGTRIHPSILKITNNYPLPTVDVEHECRSIILRQFETYCNIIVENLDVILESLKRVFRQSLHS